MSNTNQQFIPDESLNDSKVQSEDETLIDDSVPTESFLTQLMNNRKPSVSGSEDESQDEKKQAIRESIVEPKTDEKQHSKPVIQVIKEPEVPKNEETGKSVEENVDSKIEEQHSTQDVQEQQEKQSVPKENPLQEMQGNIEFTKVSEKHELLTSLLSKPEHAEEKWPCIDNNLAALRSDTSSMIVVYDLSGNNVTPCRIVHNTSGEIRAEVLNCHIFSEFSSTCCLLLLEMSAKDKENKANIYLKAYLLDTESWNCRDSPFEFMLEDRVELLTSRGPWVCFNQRSDLKSIIRLHIEVGVEKSSSAVGEGNESKYLSIPSIIKVEGVPSDIDISLLDGTILIAETGVVSLYNSKKRLTTINPPDQQEPYQAAKFIPHIRDENNMGKQYFICFETSMGRIYSEDKNNTPLSSFHIPSGMNINTTQPLSSTDVFISQDYVIVLRSSEFYFVVFQLEQKAESSNIIVNKSLCASFNHGYQQHMFYFGQGNDKEQSKVPICLAKPAKFESSKAIEAWVMSGFKNNINYTSTGNIQNQSNIDLNEQGMTPEKAEPIKTETRDNLEQDSTQKKSRKQSVNNTLQAPTAQIGLPLGNTKNPSNISMDAAGTEVNQGSEIKSYVQLDSPAEYVHIPKKTESHYNEISIDQGIIVGDPTEHFNHAQSEPQLGEENDEQKLQELFKIKNEIAEEKAHPILDKVMQDMLSEQQETGQSQNLMTEQKNEVDDSANPSALESPTYNFKPQSEGQGVVFHSSNLPDPNENIHSTPKTTYNAREVADNVSPQVKSFSQKDYETNKKVETAKDSKPAGQKKVEKQDQKKKPAKGKKEKELDASNNSRKDKARTDKYYDKYPYRSVEEGEYVKKEETVSFAKDSLPKEKERGKSNNNKSRIQRDSGVKSERNSHVASPPPAQEIRKSKYDKDLEPESLYVPKKPSNKEQTSSMELHKQVSEPEEGQLGSQVVQDIKSELKSFLDNRLEELSRSLRVTIEESGPREELLEERIRSIIERYVEEKLIKDLKNNFNCLMSNNYNEAFEELMVPCFEKYLIKVFDKTSNIFERGLKYYNDRIQLEERKINQFKDQFTLILNQFLANSKSFSKISQEIGQLNKDIVTNHNKDILKRMSTVEENMEKMAEKQDKMLQMLEKLSNRIKDPAEDKKLDIPPVLSESGHLNSSNSRENPMHYNAIDNILSQLGQTGHNIGPPQQISYFNAGSEQILRGQPGLPFNGQHPGYPYQRVISPQGPYYPMQQAPSGQHSVGSNTPVPQNMPQGVQYRISASGSSGQLPKPAPQEVYGSDEDLSLRIAKLLKNMQIGDKDVQGQDKE